MHFCFIIEAQYKHQLMPMAVARQLMDWGHNVELLEPETTITSLTRFTKVKYDAYVLKTVSDGPGLSILEAVEAIDLPTINNSRAIHLVRNKAVAAVYAQNHGLPTPLTYFVAHPDLLKQIPEEDYPLVVKPANGSSSRGIYRVDSPTELEKLNIVEANARFFLAQQYIENSGFDIKLYVVGPDVFAVAKRSPLHPEVEVKKRIIPVTAELGNLALNVGKLFRLDIYGLDVVETPLGPMIVDINDFPSFSQVPHAISLVSSHIVRIAMQQLEQRERPTTDMLSEMLQELTVNIL
jgi:ribosomal protein S6--L-glutamate ligase